MPSKSTRGFTLVETMAAAAIFLVVFAVVMDSYQNMMRDSRRDQLAAEANQACRKVTSLVKKDLETAGYRLGFPSDTVLPGPAVQTITGGIRLYCVKELGTLAAAYTSGNTVTVDSAAPFSGAAGGYLAYAREGAGGIRQITAVNGTQVTLANELNIVLPESAWVAVIQKIEYKIEDGNLTRAINGGTAVLVTAWVQSGSGFTVKDGSGATATQIEHGSPGFVDFALTLTRQAGGGSRGMTARASASQRVAFLNTVP